MTNFEKVCLWNELSMNKCLDKAGFPEEEVQGLSMGLIMEEVEELVVAIVEDDLVETADALGDILYVVYGMCYRFGINADAVFNEVHRSNMTKFCANRTEAFATMKYYSKEEGIETYFQETDSGKYIVKRSHDNKVLKNVKYVKPDIESVL